MKKKLAICLSLAIVCAALVSCGCGGSDVTTTGATTTTTQKRTTTKAPTWFEGFVLSKGARAELLDDAYLQTISPNWEKRVCHALNEVQVQTLEEILQNKSFSEAERDTDGYDALFDLFTNGTDNYYWYYIDLSEKTVLRIAPTQAQGATDGKATLSDAELQTVLSVLTSLFAQN